MVYRDTNVAPTFEFLKSYNNTSKFIEVKSNSFFIKLIFLEKNIVYCFFNRLDKNKNFISLSFLNLIQFRIF